MYPNLHTLTLNDGLPICGRLSAQVALQVLGCPRSYYAPGTILASRLVARLAEAISHPDNEPEEELNSWQTEAILNQAEQAVCKGLEANRQIKQRFLALGR